MAKKKIEKGVVVKNELSQSELQELAHTGKKKSIERIEKYIKTEKDPEKRACAEIALEECEMFYYQPTSEKEEKEFMLCELIRRRKVDIANKMIELERLELILEKSELERKVHEKILKKHKDKKEDWKYNWMPDFVLWEKNKLEEIKEAMAYDQAWVIEAKKMISVDRYKNIPASYLEHFDFDLGEDCIGDDCGCAYDCDCEDDHCSEPPF